MNERGYGGKKMTTKKMITKKMITKKMRRWFTE
jgi:hypothetical protein